MSEAHLELRDVAFAWPRSAFRLRVPSLTAATGEQIACIGPSGCGKTTLVGLATGILVPDAGTVRCDGRELSREPDVRRRAWRLARVGLVFQEFELLEHLSALENILLPFHLVPALGSGRGGPGKREIERARSLADRAGIGPLLRRKPRRLSHGERQRVAVCRALVTDPPLLVGDEPTGSLDPVTAGAVLELILGEARAAGRTVLVVTHDHAALERFDRVVDLGAPAGERAA